MKAYTNIEQSKKLAKILPIESADKYYFRQIDSDCFPPNVESILPIPLFKDSKEDFNYDIPCWSLAALLDFLPPYLYESERGIDLNIYLNLNGKGWHCSYMPNCIENMKEDKFRLITNGDNLIDACYEMIIKLKERNLI